jgi:hypothetical protein
MKMVPIILAGRNAEFGDWKSDLLWMLVLGILLCASVVKTCGTATRRRLWNARLQNRLNRLKTGWMQGHASHFLIQTLNNLLNKPVTLLLAALPSVQPGGCILAAVRKDSARPKSPHNFSICSLSGSKTAIKFKSDEN